MSFQVLEGGQKLQVQTPEVYGELYKPHRYKAYYGGRGSGKSHQFATALLVRGMQRPLRVLCCREIQNSIKESVKLLLEDKIRDLRLREHYSSTDVEVRGANGTLFMFAGLRGNPDSIRSKEGLDVAWVEEAARASSRSIDILRPTMRNEESELWFSWNPESPDDAVDNMSRGGPPPPRSVVRKVSFRDNPWFTKALREELSWDRSRDPEKYDHIWEGEYLSRSSARVFHNFKAEEFETPRDVRFLFGADWGFSVDPTVLVRCFILSRKLYIDQECWQLKCPLDRTVGLFDSMENRMARRHVIVADSARPDSIDYMKRNGYPLIQPSTKGARSLEEGVEFLKNYDLVVHPRCKHTLWELQHYKYKVDKRTDEVLPDFDDKHNHVIDALRYAVERIRRGDYALLRNLG